MSFLSRPTRSSAIAFSRSGAIARPATAATSPASKAASRSASSAASRFGRFVLLTAVIAFVAVVPLVALLQGSDPVSCLLWVLLYGGMVLVYALWPQRRPVPAKPSVVNYPATEHFWARWGTRESESEPRATRMTNEAENAQAASVPLFIVNEPLPGSDPQVLEARRACVVDIIQDELERAKVAGLTGEDLTWHLARVIGGCKQAARGSKASQPVGSGGDGGGWWGGQGRVRVEGCGPKGYLRGK
jgi:hypothetical protein